ncbi:MAG: substrate-binding domain-containing protein, partial [FCB group bacterium]|nr:substrate-binding domain-containing protein [FCB group bacterium]
IAFIGSDDTEIGARLMNELAKQMDKQGAVAVLAGNTDAPNLKKRTAGIIAQAEKYPDISIVGVYHHKETESDAITAMLDAQKVHPEIQGWAMVGGWPLFGNKLLNVIDPGHYKIAAMDALPEQLPYIENGMVQVLLGQPTYLWGKKSVEMIVDKLYLDKEIPENNGLNFIPVTIDNLGGWSRQLRAWGFTGIPVKYLTM